MIKMTKQLNNGYVHGLHRDMGRFLCPGATAALAALRPGGGNQHYEQSADQC